MSENITRIDEGRIAEQPAPDPIFDSPIYKLITGIEDDLRTINAYEETVSDAQASLLKKKAEKREAIKSKLNQLAGLIDIPEQINTYGSTLHIPAEWYEHKDILEAVRLVQEPRYKSAIDLVKESRQKEAA